MSGQGDAQAALGWIATPGTALRTRKGAEHEVTAGLAALGYQACAVVPAAEYDRLRDRDEALARVEVVVDDIGNWGGLGPAAYRSIHRAITGTDAETSTR